MAPASFISDGVDKAPGPFAGVGALIGLSLTFIVGAVLTVVFAATLAVVVLTAGALVLPGRRGGKVGRLRSRPVRYDGGMVLEARKVGHRWVAYGWDRRGRWGVLAEGEGGSPPCPCSWNKTPSVLTYIDAPSPNFDARPAPPDMVVIHYTGMPTGEAALAKLCDHAAARFQPLDDRDRRPALPAGARGAARLACRRLLLEGPNLAERRLDRHRAGQSWPRVRLSRLPRRVSSRP